MTASDIKAMSDDDLLDMHYFLEDDDFNPEDEVGAEGFYIFQTILLVFMPASARAFLVQDFSGGEISYKVKKE